MGVTSRHLKNCFCTISLRKTAKYRCLSGSRKMQIPAIVVQLSRKLKGSYPVTWQGIPITFCQKMHRFLSGLQKRVQFRRQSNPRDKQSKHRRNPILKIRLTKCCKLSFLNLKAKSMSTILKNDFTIDDLPVIEVTRMRHRPFAYLLSDEPFAISVT